MNIIVKYLILLALLCCSGCASYCRIDGPYIGKVIDAETKQPLEGVVILGVWNKVQLTVAGPTGSFYDSIEVLTDKNGEFKIPGQGLLLFSNIRQADLVIFKAGYEMIEGSMIGFKTRTAMKFTQWDGDKVTYLLRKMSYEKRKKMQLPSNYTGEKRMPFITDEINKERVEFGYNPL